MTALSRRGLGLGALSLLAAPASAQSGTPDRPVRIIVPYNAGGITDVISRGMAIGLGHPSRIELTPNVPTLSELGVPLATGLWLALYAPARTPQHILARLNEAVRQGMANEQTLAVFRQQAGAPEHSTPAALAEFVRGERTQWGNLAREKGIVVE